MHMIAELLIVFRYKMNDPERSCWAELWASMPLKYLKCENKITNLGYTSKSVLNSNSSTSGLYMQVPIFFIHCSHGSAVSWVKVLETLRLLRGWLHLSIVVDIAQCWHRTYNWASKWDLREVHRQTSDRDVNIISISAIITLFIKR